MNQNDGYTPDEFIEFFMACQDSGLKGFHALEDMPEEWLMKAPEESLIDALERLNYKISSDKNGFKVYTLWVD